MFECVLEAGNLPWMIKNPFILEVGNELVVQYLPCAVRSSIGVIYNCITVPFSCNFIFFFCSWIGTDLKPNKNLRNCG